MTLSDAHELRIWPMRAAEVELTCHMVMPNGHPGDAVIAGAERRLHSRFGISHATLQVEISDGSLGTSVAA